MILTEFACHRRDFSVTYIKERLTGYSFKRIEDGNKRLRWEFMYQDRVKVSIIMTTYNHARYVAQAIDSILLQEVGFRWELLIGDDASTDETTQIVQRYASQHQDKIVPIMRKENIGASRNFWDLLQRARGQYIAILEGDDLWTSTEKLQKQVQYMDTHSEIAACVHEVLLIDRMGNALACQTLAWVRPRRHFRLKNYDGVQLPGHISSLLLRKNILMSQNVDKLLLSHMQISDRTIFLALLAKGEIFCFPQVMSAYRILRGSEDDNLTQTIYLSQNKNFLDEMALFANMSDWLWNEYGVSKSFARAKCGVVLSALWGCNRVTNNVCEYLWKLLKKSGCAGRILLYVPIVTIQKFCLRLIKIQR